MFIKCYVCLLLPVVLAIVGCRGSDSVSRIPFPFKATASASQNSTRKTEMVRLNLPSSRERAPEFPREFAWVNTDRPLFLRENLKGCIVVLDFWTYCCINCMHVLPELEYLEHKYADQPVVVIGVHSAKFDNESDRANIATACQRYAIAHPVIVDEGHRVWSEYGVRAWPTLVVIDSEGRIVGSLPGEGNRDGLDAVVATLLEEGQKKGTLADAAPKFGHAGRVPSASGLAFPGKVLAAEKRLFISDSNHDRVIVADNEGRVTAIAGSGRKGQRDGSFSEAEFDNPQGLAYDSKHDLLYVADTDNHLIRKLDLVGKTVETISGTGQQAHDRTGGQAGRQQGLNSPWDLVLDGDQLFIAMAGPHQLWVLDLTTLIAQVWVGSGREDIEDGKGLDAALAQPSGLVRKGDWLYFADSEVSAVRRAHLKTRDVETLIGSGLFDFGDRIGNFDQALLQHPLGLAVDGNDILVADTYNHKIKRLDERTRTISLVAGNGRADAIPISFGELSLYEPGGLSVRGDLAYIADTNHDRIIELQLRTGAWREFTLTGLRTEAARQMDMSDAPLREVRVKPGSDVTLRFNPVFAIGTHLNREAPMNYTFLPTGDPALPGIEPLISPSRIPAEVVIPASAFQNGDHYLATLSFAYCTDDNQQLCVPVSLAWRLHIVHDSQAVETVDLTASVP